LPARAELFQQRRWTSGKHKSLCASLEGPGLPRGNGAAERRANTHLGLPMGPPRWHARLKLWGSGEEFRAKKSRAAKAAHGRMVREGSLRRGGREAHWGESGKGKGLDADLLMGGRGIHWEDITAKERISLVRVLKGRASGGRSALRPRGGGGKRLYAGFFLFWRRWR